MNLQVRVKASFDPRAQWALSKVGGSMVNVKGREMFRFDNQVMYNEYRRYLREGAKPQG